MLMPGLDSEDGILQLVSILSLISSILNFIFIVIFLRIREKKQVHRLFINFNLSLLAATFGLLGILSSKTLIQMNPVQGASSIFTFSSMLILYAGISIAMAHWIFLAACTSGRMLWFKGWKRITIYLPSGTILAVLLIAPLLGRLIGQDLSPVAYRIANILSLFSAIIFECVAFFLYLKNMRNTKQRQAIVMVLASFLPFLGGGLYLFSTFLPLQIEPSLSITFLLTPTIIGNALFAFTLIQQKSMDLLPKAMQETFHNLDDAIIILDQKFKAIYVNPFSQEIFPNIDTGKAIAEQVYQMGTILEKIEADPSETSEFEMGLKGFIYLVKTLPIMIDHHPSGWIIRLSDITKLKHTEEQLIHNTLHDRLTKLPNRTLLLDRLNHAILSAQRDENFKYAVLSMDLDHFKRINDNLGRQLGDQVLIEVAKRLETCLRKVDTAARMEGDEFVILLEKISGVRAATEVSLRVIELVSQSMHLNDQDLFTSVSIGIAVGSQRHKKSDDILREADIALHEAKERGRSQFVIYDKEMHSHISTLFNLETKLQSAVQQNEFVFHYQPILSLSDQRIFGFEALLRWTHPEYGMMLPAEFLPEAEGTDLIVPIGQWGFQQACHDISEWNSRFSMDPPLLMCINLSQKELLEPDLSDHIDSILKETKCLPSCLAIEIREKMLVENDTKIMDILLKLKSIGVKIVVDQFGTGNSSLRILSTIPIDIIKIDRTFIRNIPRSIKDYEIVRFMINLGDRLKIGVIAEGVEAPHEYVELKSMQCNLVQGDYFYKPIPVNEVNHLLEKMAKRKEEISKINHRKLFNSVK
jgi:diguanylate cyclase (GGDEF)-like protein